MRSAPSGSASAFPALMTSPENAPFQMLLVNPDHGLEKRVAALDCGHWSIRAIETGGLTAALRDENWDLVLVGEDGFGVLPVIRAHFDLWSLPVVLAACNPDEVAPALAQGANECLARDLSREEFHARMNLQRQLLAQRRDHQTHMARKERQFRISHREMTETAQELQRRNRELEMIDAIVQSVHREKDFDKVVDSLLRQGMDLLPGACNAVFLRYHPQTRQFYIASALGYPKKDLAEIRYSRDQLLQRLTTGVEQLERGVYIGRLVAGEELPSITAKIPIPRATLAMLVNPFPGMEGFMVWDNPTDPAAFDGSDARRLARFRRHAVAALDKAWSFAKIRRNNEEIRTGLSYAHQVQKALRPNQEDLAHLPPCFVLHKPRDLVASDFIWRGGNRQTGFLAVGDCGGNSMAGALVSVVVIELLNRCLRENLNQPDQIFNRLHQNLKSIFQGDDARDFAVQTDVVLCRFDRDLNRVIYAGARRPLYWIRTATRGRSKSLMGERCSLGGSHSEPRFSAHEIEVRSGDMLYLTTDGFALQTDEQGAKFGVLALKKLLESMAEEPLEHQAQGLLEGHLRFRGDMTQQDDFTLVGLRID